MSKEKIIELLEAIVELEGHCLNADKYCKQCPFKSRCLPTFLRKETRTTPEERLQLALNILTNAELLDHYDDDEGEDYFINRDR